MKPQTIWLTVFSLFSTLIFAQTATLEGYVFESGNRGYLQSVDVKIFEKNNSQILLQTKTNADGIFSVEVPLGKTYRVEAIKDLFETQSEEVTVNKSDKGKKVFVKLKMERKAGYLFDVTMAETMVKGKSEVDAIVEAKIEVFNNTRKEKVLEIPNHPFPNFQVNFEQGNHYTILISKKGYFSKRMEAKVNVAGCILCFEGVGEINRNVSDVLTDQNKKGTILANVELRPIILNQPFPLKNIFYSSNSAEITEATKRELDEAAKLLRTNGDLIVEVGSHTDSKGQDPSNLQLSQQRANTVVNYLANEGGVSAHRLVSKGYGETRLVNYCANGVTCTDEMHQQNRRTELMVIKQLRGEEFTRESLENLLELEHINNQLLNLGSEVQVRPGEELPIDIVENVQSYDMESIRNQEDIAAKSYSTESTRNQENANIETVKSYSAETNKIQENKNINPQGVPLYDALTENDPYAEVTNGTKLIDEQYDQSAEREAMKKTPMPTAYSVQKVDDITTPPPAVRIDNSTRPSDYGNEDLVAGENFKGRTSNIGETEVYLSRNVPKLLAVPRNYSGYKIEFMTVLRELEGNHPIFYQHGNIVFERKTDGNFAYLLGDFSEAKEAQVFLEEVMLPRYENAFIVYYQNGIRTNLTKVAGFTTAKLEVPR